MNSIKTSLFLILIGMGLHAQHIASPDLQSRLEAHVSFLASDSLQGRGLGTKGKSLAMEYIATQFREIGLQSYDDSSYFQKLDLKFGLARVPAVNVIGWLPGSGPGLQNDYIVIGAHYDHLGYSENNDEKVIYHGADDNASGVAGMIELARYFASNPGLAKRSLIFIAFDAEESGLLGSNEFVKANDPFEIAQVRAMFSLDMIGMYTPNHGLVLDGIGTLADGVKLADEVALDQDVILKKTTSEIGMRTDTWPFGLKGVPAVHVFTGAKSPYHKPEDIYEKLDYEGMVKVVAYLQKLVTDLGSAPEIEPSRQFARSVSPDRVRMHAGISAGFGTSRLIYPKEYFNPKPIFCYHAGVFMQVNLGGPFWLQPAVLFQSDGSKSSDGNFRRQSIIVPVDLHISLIDQYNGIIQVYPIVGGYYLNTFSAKDGEEGLNFKHSVSKDEWGLDLGLGTDIMDWQITFTWRRALTNLSLESGTKMFPSMWFLSAGYKL